MVLEIYYKGELKAQVVDDEIMFKELNSEFQQLMEETIVSIEQVEDEWGNVIFVKRENTLNKKLVFLKSLGFEVKNIEDTEKSLTKEATLDAGDDVIEEATDYNDFLKQKFDSWEKTIQSSIEQDLKEELHKDYVQKSFGDFLRRLFGAVHTADFLSGLKKVIKLSLKQGIGEAEKELNMDIGVGVDFDQEVKYFADRQLDGFTIDGKRWHGLKGVAQDLQNDVSNIVAEGINNKLGVKEIQKQITKLFNKYRGGMVQGEITQGRTMRIARTESNRFICAGKLQAFKDSGLKGYKRWSSYIDDRTTVSCYLYTKVCRRGTDFLQYKRAWLSTCSTSNLLGRRIARWISRSTNTLLYNGSHQRRYINT